MAATWLDPDTGLLAVRFDYDAELIDALKAMIPPAHRRWNASRKLWFIDPPYEHDVRRLLGLKPVTPIKVGLSKALDVLFAELPEHLHEATFKALRRTWHPDVGGDTVSAQTLNAWRQRRAS
jgi:hypothetical protein